MPIKLPSYERQVRTTPLQAPQAQVVNASIAPGLDALGKGIQQLGAGLARAEYHKEVQQHRDDSLAVNVAVAELGVAKRQLLEEGDAAFLGKLGQNAINESKSYKEQLANYAKVVRQKLSPAQQAMLEPIIIGEVDAFDRAVDGHVSKQKSILEEESTKAILNGKASEAASAALRGDMAAMDDAFSAAEGQLDDMQVSQGWTPVIRAEKERLYKSGARMGVLETLLGAGDAQRAAQLLAQWGGELDQDKLNDSKLRQRIEGAVVKQQAEGTAALAWGLSKNNLADAEKRINEAGIEDDKARELALDLVRKQAHEYDQGLRRADGERMGRITEAIARGRGRVTLAELDAHPDMIAMQRPESRAAMVEAMNAEARRKSLDGKVSGGQKAKDAAAELEFLHVVADDPDAARVVNISERFAGTSPAAQKRMLERQIRLDTAEGKKQAIALSEFNRLATAEMAWMNKGEAKKTRGELLSDFVAYELEHGAPMPRTEALKAIEYRAAKVKIDGLLWDSDGTRAQADAQGKKWIPPKDAPAEKLPDITAPPKVQKSDIVWMRAPDGGMLQVQPSDVAKYEKLGAKVVQR
jgi:hypothetical protein